MSGLLEEDEDYDDDYDDDDDEEDWFADREKTCDKCAGKGLEDGCPKCGNHKRGDREINGEKYVFVTNCTIKSQYHEIYKKVSGRIKILFDEDARSKKNEPVADAVAIWVAKSEMEEFNDLTRDDLFVSIYV